MPQESTSPPPHDDHDGIIIYSTYGLGAILTRDIVSAWTENQKYRVLLFVSYAMFTDDNAADVMENCPDFLRPFLPE